MKLTRFRHIDYLFLVILVSLQDLSGAPNENIVQNHLNIALLNVLTQMTESRKILTSIRES